MSFSRPPDGTVLYKYYPPSTAAIVLSSGKIRFSPLIEFNDPFEAATYPAPTFTIVDFATSLANDIYEVIESGEGLTGTSEINPLIKAFQDGRMSEISSYDFAVAIGALVAKNKTIQEGPSVGTRNMLIGLSRLMGAFCLTEKHDNLLMWGHYAKSHEGFVIGIDPNKVGKDFDHIAPVTYQQKYPGDLTAEEASGAFIGRARREKGSTWDAVRKQLFVKSLDWEYEKEWRVIKSSGLDPALDHRTYDKEKQLVEIPAEAFVSLHIGCRSALDDTRDCVRKLHDLNASAQIFHCRISTTSYSLERRLLNERDMQRLFEYVPKLS